MRGDASAESLRGHGGYEVRIREEEEEEDEEEEEEEEGGCLSQGHSNAVSGVGDDCCDGVMVTPLHNLSLHNLCDKRDAWRD